MRGEEGGVREGKRGGGGGGGGGGGWGGGGGGGNRKREGERERWRETETDRGCAGEREMCVRFDLISRYIPGIPQS